MGATQLKLTWRKSLNGFISHDGVWRIRGPLGFKHGVRVYWIYKNNCRFTPTGKFADSVHALSVAAAKRIIEANR